MYIDLRSAKILFKLGFPHKSLIPGDAYAIGEQEWIVGGEVAPNQNPIIPPQVLKTGIWLPSMLDLWIWLSFYADGVSLEDTIDIVNNMHVRARIKKKNLQDIGYSSCWFSLAKTITQLLTLFKKKRAIQFSHTPPKTMYPIPEEIWKNEPRYVSEAQMRHLSSLGFKIDHAHLLSEGDSYLYQGKTFVLGGPLFFQKEPKILCSSKIREEGMRIASVDDFETWLSNRVSYGIIKEKGKLYKGFLSIGQGDFWIEGHSLLETQCNLIAKLLEIDPSMVYCDQPEPVLLQK